MRRHGGKELDTAGDGFFAVFDAPASAIACALEIADEVKILGIETRAGIHTGEVEQAGQKVAGITVPIASRIMAALCAEPSQVSWFRPLSATLRQAHHSSLPSRWRTRAERRPGRVARLHGQSRERGSGSGSLQESRGAPGGSPGRRRLRRSRSRPIWQRRPRAVALVAVGVVAILAVGGLLVWQPWLAPALTRIDSDSVGVVDPARHAIVASIKVNARPGGVAVADGSAWIANTGSDTVSQIDVGSQRQTRVIDVGRDPVGIVAAGGSIWVANSGDRTVTRINMASGRATDTITVGNGPLVAAASGDGVWVVNATDSTVSRIDANSGTVTTVVPVAAGPVAITGDDAGIWLASADTASVSHLEGTSGVTLAPPINLPSRPTSIALGADALWVANADGTITRIDPEANRVTATVDLGGSATAVVADAHGVWVADRDGFLVRLDPANPAAPPTRVATTNSVAALAFQEDKLWAATGSAPASHRGGTLRVVTLQPPVLDASLISPVTPLEADGLVAHRHVGGSAGGALLADLATALPKPSNGGLTYSFQLRQGLDLLDG